MKHASLWAGIFCPQLALQAVLRWSPVAEPDTPLVVHEAVNGHARVIETNSAARELGVHSGQRLADALAIAPSLECRGRDRPAERQLVDQIALVAYEYSHQVAPNGDGVVLEIGGSQQLHGPTDTLLDHLIADLGHADIVARAGSAPVPAAACLLARYSKHARDPDTLKELLRRWPLDRLGLDSVASGKLSGLGLKHLGAFLDLPRFERTRRLGAALNRYVDELCGHVATPLVYWKPPETFSQRLDMPRPSAQNQALLFALNRMLEHLEQWLRVRDRSLTLLEVELHPEDRGRVVELHAGLNRTGFCRTRVLEILRLKLEPVRITAPVETLVMRAAGTTEARPAQADLWNERQSGDAWPALLDRLGARVGTDKLCSIAPCADHRPEKAWRWAPPGTTTPATDSPPRPSWLLPEPRPCQVDRLRLLDGPERIESGWWDGHDCRRDYWTAHDRHGNRLWVFREYKPRRGWFVHGLFG